MHGPKEWTEHYILFRLPFVRGLGFLHAIMVANGGDPIWASAFRTGKTIGQEFDSILKRHEHEHNANILYHQVATSVQ